MLDGIDVLFAAVLLGFFFGLCAQFFEMLFGFFYGVMVCYRFMFWCM
jgi:hypothetical protein